MPRNNQGTCAVLHRQDFINDEHVEAFCEEVAAAITTPESSRLHARVFPHQYFDRDHGHTRTFSKFDDALTQYNWDGQTFVQTEVKLRDLAEKLRKAGEAADTNQNTLSTLVACFDVLDWGGGGALRSSNVDWLVKNIVPGSPLGDLLRDAVGALGDGNRNRDANLSGFRRDTYRSNAGFTKIYSLLSENTFVIYDSRVAAALGTPTATSTSPTRGHGKFPRLGDGTNGTLVGAGVLGNAGGGFLQPPALAVELQQVAVVHEAVEQRADHHHVAEQRGPVLETTV